MGRLKQNKKTMIVTCIVTFLICGITLGYALLSSTLKISGTGTISTNWDILFTRIEEKTKKGATGNQSEIVDKLTAAFDVDIEAPGNYIEYNVTIKNNGNIDAVIESVTGIAEANREDPTGIQFKVSGIRIGDDLLAGVEKTFVVRAEIPSGETTLPSGTKTLDLKVNVRQKDIDSSGLVTTFKDCFQTNENGNIITKYLCGKDNTNGYSEILDVNIPREINGVDITQIGYQAFYMQGINAVVIPNTITIIGDQAFFNNQLQELHLPSSVNTIGVQAFMNNRLTELEIPSSVTTIDTSAFLNNRMVDDRAFIYNRNSDGTENKTSLNSYAGVNRDRVVIPTGVKKIGMGAFLGIKLNSIVISSGIEEIGFGAFENCGLSQIVIPESLKTIGSYAFASNRLTSLELPSQLTSLGQNAFQKNNLQAVEFKGIVPRTLGIDIFAFNNQLTTHTVKIPVGMLEQYKTAQGSDGNKRYLPSRTWFGSDTAGLDAFYE